MSDPLAPVAELSRRLGRCPDLDTLVSATLAGLAELFGYRHSLLLLLDEEGTHLYTLASHGYESQGVGSEVRLGEGIIGMAAARAAPMRIGNLGSMLSYARSVRRTYEATGGEAPGLEIPLPGLATPQSQLAVPAMVLGQLLGVLAVESERPIAFDTDDESRLVVIAALLAGAIELDAARERAASERLPVPSSAAEPPAPAPPTASLVRFFAVDGSTFVDGDYLIKGVAGRVLWALLGHYERDGRVDFTNKEIRLDPSLELPEFRDNLESRLILLKRRLDERGAPVRLTKSGRGRLHLEVDGPLRLEQVG